MSEKRNVQHPFGPVFDANSQVLVLGSFPSPASRAANFFYGHPQNRFWPMMAQLFDEPVPTTVQRKRDLVLRHHVALWDSLASCSIEGASDASIADAQPNDFSEILSTARIGGVFCNGSASARFYTRYCEAATGIPCVKMPSTSPANAAWNMKRLLGEWGAVKDCLEPFEPPALDVKGVVALEQAIARDGTPLAELMDRAGCHLSYHAHRLAPSGEVVVLCGTGNNGGDGWVAARELSALGHAVTLVCAKAPDELTTEPAAGTARRLHPALKAAGVDLLVAPSGEEVSNALARAGLIVDAILGTGFAHDEVREPYRSWIELVNAQHEAGVPVVAADVPSGVNADTGRAASPSIFADATVTMIVRKPGLVTGADAQHAGTVAVAPLSYIEPYFQ